MSVPNSLNVRTTAGETGMLFGHWFPPHITSLAGYINYIVNVRHSYAVVSIKKYHSMTHFNSSHVYLKLTKYHFITRVCKTDKVSFRYMYNMSLNTFSAVLCNTAWIFICV